MLLLLALLAAIPAGRLEAADWQLFGPNAPDIEFHGFASQGFLDSTDYNYLGHSKTGSFEFTELGLNTSFNPFPRMRIAAQAFAYDVGDAGRYDPVLDYALAEYTFNDYFGIRAGRIRRPEGIYNDIQDVDLGRTFVLLPQGVYDARFRDFYVSLDGGEIFGTVPLGQAGSLTYEIYGGLMRPSMDGGVALQFRNSLPPTAHLDQIIPCKLYGGQLWWITPIDGLRLGVGGCYSPWTEFTLTAQTPAGTVHLQNPSDTFTQQYSAEYQWKEWTFQTEFYFLNLNPEAAGVAPSSSFSWYASAEYRFNKWFEVGSYYTQYYNESFGPSGPGTGSATFPSDAYQKDLAVALRFDITDRWIFKVEGHYINGTALLQDNVDNPVRRENGWMMIAIKSTISF